MGAGTKLAFVVYEVEAPGVPAQAADRAAQTAPGLTIRVQGAQAQETEFTARVLGRATLGPLRDVAEALGYRVAWETLLREIVLTKEGVTVVLYPGRENFSVNGQWFKLNRGDIPTILDGKTYMAVEKLAELLEADAHWRAQTLVIGAAPSHRAAAAQVMRQRALEMTSAF